MIVETSTFLGGLLLGGSMGFVLYLKEYKGRMVSQKDLYITTEALRWCTIQRDEARAQGLRESAEVEQSLNRTMESLCHRALSEFFIKHAPLLHQDYF